MSGKPRSRASSSPGPPPEAPARWLLLIHQLPPRPAYLRAKIGQRLASVGALALKNSVYVLPDRDDCREDLEWIAQESIAGGGQAWITRVEWLAGTRGEELRDAFLARAANAYQELVLACRSELAGRRPRELAASGELPALLAGFRARFERLAKNDFFESAERQVVAAWLDELATEGARDVETRNKRKSGVDELRGKVWVTRGDVFVDRIGTAWLVRRFIDPDARFRFIAGSAAAPAPGEIRFDLAEAELTHDGDRCTFEVLLERLGSADPGLRRLAQIVHDVDLKDGRYGHPETAGLEQLLVGLVALEPEDERRLEGGFRLFDALYRAFTPGEPKQLQTL